MTMTTETLQLKVMADPVMMGKHPYHDSRFIVTKDAEMEWNIDGTEWRLERGSIVAMMRDVDPKFAALIVQAVNEHSALCSVAEATRMAEALLRQIPAFGDSVGKEISKAQIGCAQNAMKQALAALDAVRKS